MLQLIRDRAQGLVVGVIVFFICLTFALFGVQQYLDARGSVVVAEVNGEEILLEDFQRAFQQLRQRAQSILGEAFDPSGWSGERAKLAALDYVIDERLLRQVSDKANIRASDAQVVNHIRTSPQFQQDGNFSSDLYKRMVRALGYSEPQFENQVANDIVVNQLRAGVAASALASTDEVQRLEQLRQQTRDIGYALLGIEQFRDAINLSDTDVQQYYDEHKEEHRTPERIAVDYIELSVSAIMDDVAVSEPQLQAFYDENQANYVAPEQRNANHILIQVGADASEEDVRVAQEKAESLREKALAGESFEDIARENSDDVGSRTDGGETGFFWARRYGSGI